jgi:hypothetical protein
MDSRRHARTKRNGERGNSLFFVAGFMFVMLGMGALAIDLASYYVARNQSQRVADSAALAGAKVFVESGCVTIGDCTGEEGLATTRATQAASQNLVEGQAVTVQAVNFLETSQNPQITVQIQSANLHLYFAGALGITTGPTVGATATAEAYNPSGAAGGAPIYCTSCARPWLIANCDQILPGPPASICGGGTLLNPGANYSVTNPGCSTGGGVVGEGIDIKLSTPPTTPTTSFYGAVDVDNGTGNQADYQTGITTCFMGQTACGVKNLTVMPVSVMTGLTTITGVENLLHITAVGPAFGQDTIDSTVCPPQIHAGALNPLVTNGVVNMNDVISTSDSIVTAYIFDQAPLTTSLTLPISQTVNIVGFAQIFVTQADPNLGDVDGVILGVAGCGSNPGACNSAAIQGATTMPVRLISTGP